MNRPLMKLVVACFLLSAGSSVLAMGGTYGKGNPEAPMSRSGWSRGLTELANRQDRLGGSWVNEFDSFTYAGDVQVFNKFLVKYAALPEGPHRLALIPPRSPTTRPRAFEVPDGDWSMSTDSHWGKASISVGVTLVVGGGIRLEDVVLPSGVHVSVSGEPTEEVEAFLTRYPNALPAPATGPTTRTTD